MALGLSRRLQLARSVALLRAVALAGAASAGLAGGVGRASRREAGVSEGRGGARAESPECGRLWSVYKMSRGRRPAPATQCVCFRKAQATF